MNQAARSGFSLNAGRPFAQAMGTDYTTAALATASMMAQTQVGSVAALQARARAEAEAAAEACARAAAEAEAKAAALQANGEEPQSLLHSLAASRMAELE